MKDKKLANAIKQIEMHKKKIATHRDALREILNDLEAVGESCYAGINELETAIDILDQYV